MEQIMEDILKQQSISKWKIQIKNDDHLTILLDSL
jgi:hypothetical protein